MKTHRMGATTRRQSRRRDPVTSTRKVPTRIPTYTKPSMRSSTATAGAAAVLERIDGFVYVGILVGTFLVLVTGSRRRLWRRVVAPILCVFIAYNAFRLWYFGSLLSMPLASKVAYKLLSPGHIVIKAPAETYTHRFLDLYGLSLI